MARRLKEGAGLLASAAAFEMPIIGQVQCVTLSPAMRSHYGEMIEADTILLTEVPHHPTTGSHTTECALPRQSEDKTYARVFDYDTR